MKFAKRLICAALAAVTMLSGAPAFAAERKPAAIWAAGNNIMVEGNFAYSWNEAGKETFYLSCGGAVYVPLRTAAEWLGKDLTKSADGTTFTLSGSKAAVYREQTADIYEELSQEERETAMVQPQLVTELSGAKLVIDGTAFALTDSAGKPVSMVDWNGDTYLPIRTIAQMLGMEVKYYQRYSTDKTGKTIPGTATVFLRTPLTNEQLQACKTYVDTIYAAGKGFTTLFRDADLDTYESAAASVDQFLTYMHTMKDTAKPDCHLLDGVYAQMVPLADNAIKAGEQVKQMIANKEDLDKIYYAIRDDWTCQTYGKDVDREQSLNMRGMMSLGINPMLAANDLRLAVYQETPGENS